MARPAEKLEIEDVDLRCEEIFPDSNERCWNLAVKAIKYQGQTKRICSAHYAQWLETLAETKAILEKKG